MAELAIELRDLRIQQGAFQLGPLSLTVPAGCHALLVGPTGSGKTTLLEVIAGLRKPQSGSIFSFGIDITAFPPGDRGIGYVPQDAVVFPTMTVRQNLAFGLAIRKTPIKIQTERVAELAERLRLTPILDRLAIGLSGGEAQRVALGRALAFRPKLLLLDEPMSALDDGTKELVFTLLEHEAVSVLHVTHDHAEGERLADLVYQLEASTSSPMNVVRVL
jgi:molybdate/tungstate transport system ATP-binding protein